MYLQFQAVCRNSFQNIRKPDITKVELLKDVENKNDLIVRLVAHDIESDSQEGLMSDENELVIREVIQEECLEEQHEDQVKVATKPIKSKVVSPKPTVSTNSLKKFLSISKCCQPTSSANIESIEATSNHTIERKERQVERAVAELHMTTRSTTKAVTDSWEKKPQYKVSEKHDCRWPYIYGKSRDLQKFCWKYTLIRKKGILKWFWSSPKPGNIYKIREITDKAIKLSWGKADNGKRPRFFRTPRKIRKGNHMREMKANYIY